MDNKIKVEMKLSDLLKDVVEPVHAILHDRNASYVMEIQCPENLIVRTDSLRLKQVVLNNVRNASKFVERGFIRIRVEVVEGLVCLFVEDSGPGIPEATKHRWTCSLLLWVAIFCWTNHFKVV